MGRSYTGAQTTSDALTLDIFKIRRVGLLRPGYIMRIVWAWNIESQKRAEIRLETCLAGGENYVRLEYAITCNGETVHKDYKITLSAQPSNLGIGQVWFFVCPVSFRVCRKIYMAYDSPIFKCRQAYKNRLYYWLQLSSFMQRHNDRYWHLERQLEALSKQRAAGNYAGKLTHRAARIAWLCEKQGLADYLRWLPETYPYSLRKMMRNQLKGQE